MTQGWNNFLNTAKAGGKTAAEYTPYVGDVIDIGEGIYQATHGHPLLGTGQALFGGAGLAANALFPGAGSIGKAAVKGVVKQGVKTATKKAGKKVAEQATDLNAIQKAMSDYAKYNRSTMGQLATFGLPNAGYLWMNGENGNQNIKSEDVNTNGNRNNVQGGSTINGNSTIQTAQQIASQLAGETQAQEQQSSNLQAIKDYISKLQEINRPYIDALTTYYNNYPKMLDQQQRAARYWMGASALTGNPKWAQMANYYNPIQNEANRLSTLKTLQDAQAGDVNAINEVMGNLAMAQEMGLPPEAAFANKNLLSAMTMRDRNLTNREIAELNNAAKLQIALQNAQNRLAVQNLRNQGNLGVANVYMGGGVAPGLNTQGTIPTQKDIRLQQAYNGIR